MSDGGKGSAPRPLSIGHEKYVENWNKAFGKHLKENEEMVRVSGVPYEVDLPPIDDVVATLEQESRQMRARMDRLEDENRRLEEEVIQLRIQLINATKDQK